MTETEPASNAPAFGARRLLLIGSGAVNVAFLPFWLNWLTLSYPQLEIQIVLTRSAEKFVTRAALTALAHHEVLPDAWPDEPQPGARHVELVEWADAVAVFPATMHFLARLALGVADTPALLALQCTPAPIVLAPALPPYGWQSPAVTGHVAALRRRPNVVIAPPRPGPSVTTGRDDGWIPPPFPTVLRFLEHRRAALAAGLAQPSDGSDQPAD
jgi:phosphopantothenoylcysteine decarboxylase/phosphopantothenate--cysteine ligase